MVRSFDAKRDLVGLAAENLQVLLVEDSRADILVFNEMLTEIPKSNFRLPQLKVAICHTLEEAKMALNKNSYHIILLDLFLPDSEDLEGFHTLTELFPQIPIIIHSGAYSQELATRVMALGAADCIPKNSMSKDELTRALITARINFHLRKQLVGLSTQAC